MCPRKAKDRAIAAKNRNKNNCFIYTLRYLKNTKKTTLKKGQDNRTVYITLTMLIAVDIVED